MARLSRRVRQFLPRPTDASGTDNGADGIDWDDGPFIPTLPLTVEESDGTPTATPVSTIKVDAADFTLVDNGDGSVSLTTDEPDAAAHIADTTDAHDASAISIVDSGGYFTSTDVEGALQELGAGGGGGGGGGGLVLLEQHTASASATLDFTACISATYDEYLIEYLHLVPATNGVGILVVCSTNGGSTWDTTAANYSNVYGFYYSGGSGGAGSSLGGMRVGQNIANGATFGVTGSARLFSAAGSAYTMMVAHTVDGDSSVGGALVGQNNSCAYLSTTLVNAIRIIATSGNLASGTVRIYGIEK